MSDNFTPMPDTTHEFAESRDVFTSTLAPKLLVRTDVVWGAEFNENPEVTSFILVEGEIARTYAHGQSNEGDMLHGYVVGVAMAAYNFMKNSV